MRVGLFFACYWTRRAKDEGWRLSLPSELIQRQRNSIFGRSMGAPTLSARSVEIDGGPPGLFQTCDTSCKITVCKILCLGPFEFEMITAKIILKGIHQ